MDIGWLEGLLYGLLSGFTEFVPVSAQAHGAIVRRMFGVGDIPFLDLMVHLASLIALLVSVRPQIHRLQRETKLTRVPKRLRKRQPDPMALMDIRLLKTAAVPMLLCYLVFPATSRLGSNFLLLAAIFIVNGIVLYLPRLMPSGNKDSRMLTPLDGVLLGIVSGLSIFPGISRLGIFTSVSQLRGADRQYSLDMALLLGIPLLVALCVIDLLWLILAEFAGIGLILVLKSILAAAAAYIGTWFGIIFVRFLAVKTGFSVFAYYCWGAALFVFILFLMI